MNYYHFKKTIKSFIFKYIRPEYGPVSFSEIGEDRIINYLFKSKKIEKIKYLDIGAHDPMHCNNTYLFYINNSSGVCIEPNPIIFKRLNECRPNDVNLNIGVSINDEKEANFYIFNISQVSTFDKEEAEKRQKIGVYQLEKIEKIELRNINSILNQYFSTYPDLISLDIEGLDLAVIQTLDFEKYPIPVLCIETCKISDNHVKPKEEKLIEFIISKNYEIYADTYANTIFVNKEWFYKT